MVYRLLKRNRKKETIKILKKFVTKCCFPKGDDHHHDIELSKSAHVHTLKPAPLP